MKPGLAHAFLFVLELINLIAKKLQIDKSANPFSSLII